MLRHLASFSLTLIVKIFKSYIYICNPGEQSVQALLPNSDILQCVANIKLVKHDKLYNMYT